MEIAEDAKRRTKKLVMRFINIFTCPKTRLLDKPAVCLYSERTFDIIDLKTLQVYTGREGIRRERSPNLCRLGEGKSSHLDYSGSFSSMRGPLPN